MRRPKTIALVFRGRLRLEQRRLGRVSGWYFRIKAGNGEIIATSESYTRCSDAVRGARRAYPGARIVKAA